MNPGLKNLHPYPFEKLAALTNEVVSNPDHPRISLAIGEPKHATPAFILEALKANLDSAAVYPTTRGSDELRETIAAWVCKRFNLLESSIDPNKNVLPANGTREAIFAFAQCMLNGQQTCKVLMPNPFYQIYEGAALLAAAEPIYLNCTKENDYIPDFASVSETNWRDCALLFICSPGNPTGAVIKEESLAQLFELSDQYNFIIAADECYSEIYFNEQEPPIGLLQTAAKLGRDDYKNCVVFHSLSKRSNVPGIRSGFIAGDENLIREFLRYRTYHGCTMAPYTQVASIEAWNDETHVKENRRLYREKFAAVLKILKPVMDVEQPDAGFYLWPRTPINDTEFCKVLLAEQNIVVLPGSFLSRESNGINPGANHIRVALVAEIQQCIEAAERIVETINSI